MSPVRLWDDVTKKYLNRQKVKEDVEYYDMKLAKIDMKPLEKGSLIRNRYCRFVQLYMYKKSLDQSRLELLCETRMVDTGTSMKGKHEKDKYSCPCYREGKEEGVQETPEHLLS